MLASDGMADDVTQRRAEYDVGQIVVALIDTAPTDQPGQCVGRQPGFGAGVFIDYSGNGEAAGLVK